MSGTLTLTPALVAAIDACKAAEAIYVPGRMSASVVELPRLELAQALLRALVEQAAYTRPDRWKTLPKPKPLPVPVVEIEMRRKRKRPA